MNYFDQKGLIRQWLTIKIFNFKILKQKYLVFHFKLSIAFQNISLYKYIFQIKAGGQVFISEVIYLQFGTALLEMQKEVAELLLKPPGMSRTTY